MLSKLKQTLQDGSWAKDTNLVSGLESTLTYLCARYDVFVYVNSLSFQTPNRMEFVVSAIKLLPMMAGTTNSSVGVGTLD